MMIQHVREIFNIIQEDFDPREKFDIQNPERHCGCLCYLLETLAITQFSQHNFHSA